MQSKNELRQFGYISATPCTEFPFKMRFLDADLILSEKDMGRFQAVLAARERRKARRYGVEISALIKADDEVAERRCMIHDISQTGALIEVEDGDSLQDFTLTVSHQCRVVRRNKEGNKLGVEFLLPWSVTP